MRSRGRNFPAARSCSQPGLAVHVQKHHPDETGNVALVPSIIAEPDYVGHNPKEPGSVELVKALDANVMVCVKLDAKNGYHYVASVYEISSGKLTNRLNSGRLKKFKEK